MAWQEAVSLHGDQASAELEVESGVVTRVRMQNLTERPVQLLLFAPPGSHPESLPFLWRR
jgi:hypothetical protein